MPSFETSLRRTLRTSQGRETLHSRLGPLGQKYVGALLASGVDHVFGVYYDEGGTMLGFGVKFAPEDAEMAGQNTRAFPVVTQYVDDKAYVVWPPSQQMREPVMPLPAGTTYSYK